MIHSLPLANVILAYHVPYIMAIRLFFVVLLIEYFVFWLFQRGQHFPYIKTFGYIILANVASFVVGFITATFIPATQRVMQGLGSTDYVWALYWGFIFAFLLSWLIEYHVVRLLTKKAPFPKLNKTIGYANTASYFILYIVTFAPIVFK